MFEKNGPVFQTEREIRAISLNEWQTPDFHVNNAGTKKKRKGFLKSLIIMEEFFLFSGGSTHQWEKSQRVLTFLTQNGSFFRKNFHDREPVENVRKKNSCWWKTSVFRSGRYWFFTGQMDFCVQTIENGWKNFQLSNQRPIFCLFKWWSHMGNYLTKAEKLQFRHSNSTWDKEFFD